jgi:hypothetical protein
MIISKEFDRINFYFMYFPVALPPGQQTVYLLHGKSTAYFFGRLVYNPEVTVTSLRIFECNK